MDCGDPSACCVICFGVGVGMALDVMRSNQITKLLILLFIIIIYYYILRVRAD